MSWSNRSYFGASIGPMVPGSQQVQVSVALDRPSEFLQSGPAIANGETIAAAGTPSYGYVGGGPNTPPTLELTGYFHPTGSKLVTVVDTTSQSAGGRNGPGQPFGAETYDQMNLNSWFFE